ncbi:Signal transduction histidine kinase [Krasilnikoviella flava]|uniref:histidine kinase n=2 Tax=Krasilnikoviella flava TaxID=526729 RepID=A0A1T5I9C8_9MICO|nr:Signal transduction histidine kinase [Krasilnikoviella flava]
MTSTDGSVPSSAPSPSSAQATPQTAARPAASPRAAHDGAPPFLLAPFDRRTWRAYGFLWLALLLAPFALAYSLITVSFMAGVAVTVVGLFVAGGVLLGARGWGSMYRRMAVRYLGVEIAEPAPRTPRKGFWRRLGGMLGDATAWRALLYMFVTFPLAIAGFVVSTVFLAVALGGMTHWFWSGWLPLQQAHDGTWHRGASFGTDWFVDTPARQLLLVAAGVILFYLWPQFQALFVGLFRLLAVGLLSPTRASLRVAYAERARAVTVEDADERLRRIERDLHDGTQAHLVAVAMQIGEARELLRDGAGGAGAGVDTAELAAVLETAHSSTKDTLAELRELARGIRPPALDAGLAVALETLAARAALPVRVHAVGLEGADLPPSVTAISYFAVAELVANATKHARASGVDVVAGVEPVADAATGAAVRALVLRVHDDGVGGAAVRAPDPSGRGSGLAGLTDRLSGVDGTLGVVSPVGGPTVITVTIPLPAPAARR